MVEADELGGHDTPDEQPQLGTGTAQEMVGAAAGQPMTANAVDRRTGTCAGAPTDVDFVTNSDSRCFMCHAPV